MNNGRSRGAEDKEERVRDGSLFRTRKISSKQRVHAEWKRGAQKDAGISIWRWNIVPENKWVPNLLPSRDLFIVPLGASKFEILRDGKTLNRHTATLKRIIEIRWRKNIAILTKNFNDPSKGGGKHTARDKKIKRARIQANANCFNEGISQFRCCCWNLNLLYSIASVNLCNHIKMTNASVAKLTCWAQ